MIQLTNDVYAVGVEDIFEQGWREFVKHVREENRHSNFRLMKVVGKVKGAEYLESLKVILKTVGAGSRIRFANKANGIVFHKPEWSGIGDIYIDQRSTPEGMRCEIYMPVKEGKYLHLTSHQ